MFALEVEERAAVLGRERTDDPEHTANADGDWQLRVRSTQIYTHAAVTRARTHTHTQTHIVSDVSGDSDTQNADCGDRAAARAPVWRCPGHIATTVRSGRSFACLTVCM